MQFYYWLSFIKKKYELTDFICLSLKASLLKEKKITFELKEFKCYTTNKMEQE